ncbi:MAG: TetR/AcrR family transcriptional regulator [Actinomycetota bacterium]|nr:TetR/AcrR family transcriptional regulator [Actinomycetota bacterium]
MSDTGDSPRGRRRDPELDAVILRATGDLLRERGYSRLRVQDVADRAGVGLGALYRRWATKRELALEALRAAVPDRDLISTGDPSADLLAALTAIAEAVQGPQGRLLTSVLSELGDDRELGDAIRDDVLGPLRRAHQTHLERILGDVDDLDLRADTGPALILFRATVLGLATTEDQLHAIVAMTTSDVRPTQ